MSCYQYPLKLIKRHYFSNNRTQESSPNSYRNGQLQRLPGVASTFLFQGRGDDPGDQTTTLNHQRALHQARPQESHQWCSLSESEPAPQPLSVFAVETQIPANRGFPTPIIFCEKRAEKIIRNMIHSIMYEKTVQTSDTVLWGEEFCYKLKHT